MANEDSENGVELVQDDNQQCPVILDGEEEQVEAITDEISHKLSGLAHSRKTRPWWRKQDDDDITKLEDQINEQRHNDENTGIGADDEDNKNSKSRLGELLNTFKSNDDNDDDHNKHGTPRRPVFKPIRLAVAKARFIDPNDNSIAAPTTAVAGKRTTLALPTAEDAAGAVSAADAANNNDIDDAASYVDIPRAPSPTATCTSTSSSPTATPENDSGIFQWLHKPSTTRSSNAASPTAVSADLPDASDPSSSSSRIWKPHKNKKNSTHKASSQGDRLEDPQAIDYAEVETTKSRRPQRSDTLLRGMMPNRSDSFNNNYSRNNSLRLPLPFRGRRKRRKGKGKKGDGDDSSSEEAMDDEELFHETLKKAGLFDRDVPEQMVTEMLWQNERGLYLLGTRYGKNALLPGDPGSWTDVHGHSTSYNTTSFPLPTPAWRWHHAEWLISMIGDVDSEGYQYSTRFSSKYWRGIPDIRFFVRRRLWIRARYRPTLKAQKIAEFTHPQSGIKSMEVAMPRSGLQHESTTAAVSGDVSRTSNELFSPILANHLDPRNPFTSYYALKAANPRELGDSISSSSTEGSSSVPHKQDIIHSNFIRMAKVLVRRSTVDRERLAWFEYWLGAREEPLHVTDVTTSHFTNAVRPKKTGKTDQAGADLADIDEGHAERPDIRDVWDLVEDRLDNLLGLFEYQETRRELLLLLKKLHNETHPEHHYKNRSSSPDHPSEILAQHEHGSSNEFGAGAATRAANGDGTHMRGEYVPRLAFWSDLDERLRGIHVTADLPSTGDLVGNDDDNGTISGERDSA